MLESWCRHCGGEASVFYIMVQNLNDAQFWGQPVGTGICSCCGKEW